MDAFCSKCHAAQVPEARYCHVCGAARPSLVAPPDVAPPPPVVCVDCGHANAGSARICRRCGARLGGAGAPPPVPAPARAARHAGPSAVVAAGFPIAGALGLLLAATAAGVAWYALNPGGERRAAPVMVASAPAALPAARPMPNLEPASAPGSTPMSDASTDPVALPEPAGAASRGAAD
ncbi:MAG: zinc ribbon domain-containing protein, partial [Burkholderiaceae bacterium]